MAAGNLMNPADWYASLPEVYVAAGAFITDPDGRLLLVKPNYREYWNLPGGICEHGESPKLACAREVREELGLDLPIGPLLVIDWLGPLGDRPDPMIHMLFDGGVLAGDTPITPQEAELDGYEFVRLERAGEYLPDWVAPRIPVALAARAAGGAVYMPDLR